MLDAPASPISEFKILKPQATLELLERRDIGGIYSIALTNIYEKLLEAGYIPDQPECWSGNHFHVYVGESYSLKLRLADHFLGDERSSNFRKTLAAVLGIGLRNRNFEITKFLKANAVVGIYNFNFEFDFEKRLIEQTACPLNIAGKGKSQFSKKLRALRKANQEV